MVRQVVLVTGGSGLVGQAVKELVAKESHDDKQWIFLSRQDADLCDPAAVRAVFELYKPTHVIHLAAYVGGLFANMVRNGWRNVLLSLSHGGPTNAQKSQMDFMRKNMQLCVNQRWNGSVRTCSPRSEHAIFFFVQE